VQQLIPFLGGAIWTTVPTKNQHWTYRVNQACTGAQMDKKKQRELTKRQKEAEKQSKQTMKLKLREVGPPDDLDIEMAALKRALPPVHANSSTVEVEGESAAALEDAIDRPQFPPQHVLDRVKVAFQGTHQHR
jgi:hypothetical protein